MYAPPRFAAEQRKSLGQYDFELIVGIARSAKALARKNGIRPASLALALSSRDRRPPTCSNQKWRIRRSAATTTRQLPPPSLSHQPVLHVGLIAPVVGSWMQVPLALLHCVAVARDASASSVAGASVRRPRLARSGDGGNDACLDNCGTDAHDTERTLRSRRSDCVCTAGIRSWHRC